MRISFRMQLEIILVWVSGNSKFSSKSHDVTKTETAEFTVQGKNFPILSGLKFSKVAIGNLQNIGTTVASFRTSFLARHSLVPWHFS